MTALKKKMKMKHVKCPYCGRTAVLRAAAYVYKDKAFEPYLYVCSGYPECDSYVGVHAGTMQPKGTLANGDLRHKRIETHRLFDAIWKSGILSRKDAYRWMQDTFSLSSSQAHIGLFSEYRCDRLMEECRKVLQNNHVITAC
jgi:ssDNA-binding Zn-finger/Zn-ribbon topoisomerase 1